MSDYVLSATLELRDKFSAQVKKAKSGFTDFERSLRGTAAAVDNAAASMEKSGVAAVKLAQHADSRPIKPNRPCPVSAARTRRQCGPKTKRRRLCGASKRN